MSDVRCRACGAAVPTAAQWCSLCFADLRQPAPVREPVSVPAAAAPAQSAAALAASTAQPAAQPAAQAAAQPADQAAVAEPATTPVVVAPGKAALWPCPRCGAQVAMALDACGDCGAGFLAGARSSTTTRLPIVGDVGTMSGGQRLLVGVGLMVVLMALFVAVAAIGGHLL